MIGHVIMEIEADEMRQAVAYYLNKDVFDVYTGRDRHRVVVTNIRERSNGNFIVEFDGWRPAEPKESNHAATNNQSGE